MNPTPNIHGDALNLKVSPSFPGPGPATDYDGGGDCSGNPSGRFWHRDDRIHRSVADVVDRHRADISYRTCRLEIERVDQRRGGQPASGKVIADEGTIKVKIERVRGNAEGVARLDVIGISRTVIADDSECHESAGIDRRCSQSGGDMVLPAR